jgi:chemotaxis protein MotB
VKENKTIIIKKAGRRAHAESHGGAWKVAYADFITALMAFFLLMWLITMVSPEKRARVAAYFKHFTIFQESGQSFMNKSSQIFNEAGESARKVPNEIQGNYNVKPEEFKALLGQAIEEKLNDIKEQIFVDIFEGGIRIQLVDQEGKPMFDLGSSKPTPLAHRILGVIGDSIKHMPNHVAVEGHTDSVGYKKANYSNWDLSTERALAAKTELERGGLDPSRLTKVAGYADTTPLILEDPTDPRNRRISVILLFPKNQAGP